MWLFDNTHLEWGVSEVANALDMPKSNTHALLSSLVQAGLLQRTGNGRYRLGWGLFALSRTLLETTEFRKEARAVMDELSKVYCETVQLGVLERNIVVYLEKIEGIQPVRVDLTGLGAANYVHCTAIGKVLLAGHPWPYVRSILETYGMPQMTPATITGLDRMESELEAIRRQGYAYNIEESYEDVCGIAAPIHDCDGQVIAALSLAVPISRFRRRREEFRDAVLRACHRVSREIGYIPALHGTRTNK
jgi:DNA-binding IclR family transcriptional regulator